VDDHCLSRASAKDVAVVRTSHDSSVKHGRGPAPGELYAVCFAARGPRPPPVCAIRVTQVDKNMLTNTALLKDFAISFSPWFVLVFEVANPGENHRQSVIISC